MYSEVVSPFFYKNVASVSADNNGHFVEQYYVTHSCVAVIQHVKPLLQPRCTHTDVGVNYTCTEVYVFTICIMPNSQHSYESSYLTLSSLLPLA